MPINAARFPKLLGNPLKSFDSPIPLGNAKLQLLRTKPRADDGKDAISVGGMRARVVRLLAGLLHTGQAD
jgi:hypothetical protein